MSRRSLFCLLGLSACGPAAQELSVRGPAPLGALQCVQESAIRLGYEVKPYGPSDRLQLQRLLPESEPRHVRWYRIEAKLQEQGKKLDLYAGTLARRANRGELVPHLVAPERALQRDLTQIQQRCIPTTSAS